MKKTFEWNGRPLEVDTEDRVMIFDDHGRKTALMYMPGLNDLVMISVDDNGWKWNGNSTAPTFSPSILTRATQGREQRKVRNHVFVRNGMVQYLSDCTHELAGKTQELPRLCDWPDEFKYWSADQS